MVVSRVSAHYDRFRDVRPCTDPVFGLTLERLADHGNRARSRQDVSGERRRHGDDNEQLIGSVSLQQGSSNELGDWDVGRYSIHER